MDKLVKGSIFKRLGAAMMDLCIALIVSMLLLNLVAANIANSVMNLDQKRVTYRETLFEAGLVIYAHQETMQDVDQNLSHKYVIVLDYNSSKEEKNHFFELGKEDSNYNFIALNQEELEITSDHYDQYLTHFYTEINKMSDFNNHKEASSLFTNGVLNTEDQSAIRKFYDDEYYNNVMSSKYLSLYQDGKITSMYSEISGAESLMTALSFMISFTIFYLVIPMFTKRRVTLGKLMMSLGLVHNKTGYIASRVQVLIRFLVFIVIELISSLYLFGLPLLISIVLMFVLQGKSIHDLLARTMVVEAQGVALYHSEEEEKIALGLLEKQENTSFDLDVLEDKEENHEEMKEEVIASEAIIQDSNEEKETLKEETNEDTKEEITEVKEETSLENQEIKEETNREKVNEEKEDLKDKKEKKTTKKYIDGVKKETKKPPLKKETPKKEETKKTSSKKTSVTKETTKKTTNKSTSTKKETSKKTTTKKKSETKK